MNKRIKKKYDKYFNIRSKRWYVSPMRTGYTAPKSGYRSLPPNIGQYHKRNKRWNKEMLNDKSYHRGSKFRKLVIRKLLRDEEKRRHIGMIGFDSIGFSFGDNANE